MRPQIRFCESVDGFRIAYTVFGDGPPLLVTPHGSLAMEYEFEPDLGGRYFEALGASFTVAYFEARGVGRSATPDLASSTESDAADIEAVAAAAGFDRFPLYGSCLFGPAAITYAAAHPDAVEALALFGTSCDGEAAYRPDVVDSLTSMMRGHWPMATRTVADLWAPGLGGLTLEAMARGMRNSLDVEAGVWRSEQYYHANVRDELSRVQAPVLAMHRTGDRITPSDEAALIASVAPDGQLHVFAGDEHWQWLGNTEELLDVLLAFLGEHRRSTGGSTPRPLSDRESEVVGLVAAGQTNAEIAEKLGISVFTVNRHVSNILDKLDAANRAEAATKAAGLGLL